MACSVTVILSLQIDIIWINLIWERINKNDILRKNKRSLKSGSLELVLGLPGLPGIQPHSILMLHQATASPHGLIVAAQVPAITSPSQAMGRPNGLLLWDHIPSDNLPTCFIQYFNTITFSHLAPSQLREVEKCVFRLGTLLLWENSSLSY